MMNEEAVAGLPGNLKDLLRLVAQRLEVSGEAMALQASAANVETYGPTWIDVKVPDGCPIGDWEDGPLSISPTVLDGRGATAGCVVIWVSEGKLTSLEQGWYTDDPPSGWPSIEMLDWEV
ncbi:hypothetical protein [Micromonospora arborensis]|uniref:hypothetical protein n=1 Tax=Micromonospora arborensis TaxID=2116518 RepID=UPI0037242A04